VGRAHLGTDPAYASAGPSRASFTVRSKLRAEFRLCLVITAPGTSDAGFLAYICYDS